MTTSSMTTSFIRRFAVIALASSAAVCLASNASAQMAPQAQPRQMQTPAKPKPAPVASSPASSPMSAQAAMPPAAQETTGQVSGGQAGGGDAIARVGNINVSAEDVRTYVASLGARDQALLAKDPSLITQAVRQMLAGQLVLQEAHARKWDQQAGVAQKLDKVRENALAELYLQSVSTPPQNFPSDEDLQKVYDANREALVMPRQFELAQVFIAAPKGADKASEDKARKSLDEALRKVKAPAADFSAVATEFGTPNGGQFGWLAESQIVPEIRNQVLGLGKGAVSEPIRLDDGWHIIKLLDTKASYTRTLPEVRDQLVLQIRSERSNALRQAYIAELLKKNPPAINELALSKILSNSNSNSGR